MVEDELAFVDEASEVEALAGGGEGGGFFDAVGQQQNGPAMVAVAGVVEPDADLENALIQATDRAGFRVPFVLDHFVRFVIRAFIKETDAFANPRRGFHCSWIAILGDRV